MIYVILGLLLLSLVGNIALWIVVRRYGTMLISFEDQIENLVETILASENTITRILKRPLFYDSPEVRGVLSALKNVRSTILMVASIFGAIEVVEDKEFEGESLLVNNEERSYLYDDVSSDLDLKVNNDRKTSRKNDNEEEEIKT